jgi:small-conductance mechanosensitive channel
VTHLPWEYLFQSFSAAHFHDLFYPIALGSLVLLVALCVIYAIRARQLRHHAPYLDLYEWLLWTGIIAFGLLLIFSVFVWDFVFVLTTIITTCAIFVWIRFVRFPPILAGYEQKLARQRYLSRQKYAHPEATIRAKTSRPGRTIRTASTKRTRKRR